MKSHEKFSPGGSSVLVQATIRLSGACGPTGSSCLQCTPVGSTTTGNRYGHRCGRTQRNNCCLIGSTGTSIPIIRPSVAEYAPAAITTVPVEICLPDLSDTVADWPESIVMLVTSVARYWVPTSVAAHRSPLRIALGFTYPSWGAKYSELNIIQDHVR